MQNINLIIDDPTRRIGPHQLSLRSLHRLEPVDGTVNFDGYGFTSHSWEWARQGWSAWWNPNHPSSWAYLFAFSDGRQGVSRVQNVVPALSELGARFDPAGPPDPVAPDPVLARRVRTTVSPDFREALIREMERNLQRPVADNIPTIRPDFGGITYTYEPDTIRWVSLDDDFRPFEEER